MKKISYMLPLFFTITGFIGIGGLGIYTLLRQPAGAKSVVGWSAFLLYGSWMLWEAPLSVGELKIREADHGRGTMELCAIVKLGLLVTLFTGGSHINFTWGLVGFGLMLFGILLRGMAIVSVGNFYSHRIRQLKTDPVNKGPYGIIRHPAYLGTFLVHTGLVMVFPNPYSLLALFLWLLAVLMRTYVEDTWLLKFPAYKRYTHQVRWRLIPGIF